MDPGPRRAGFERREVDAWSLPKLRLRELLIAEAKLNEFMAQSVAVWEPKEIVNELNNIKAELGGNAPPHEWSAPSPPGCQAVCRSWCSRANT